LNNNYSESVREFVLVRRLSPNVSTPVWVNFKVFGLLCLTMIFTTCQLGLMQRFALESERPTELERETDESADI